MLDPGDDPAAVYKGAKEAFVTGHSGTTTAEIILVTLPTPIGLWLLAEIKAVLQLVGADGSDLGRSWREFALEFAVVVVPALAALTCTSWTGPMLVGMASCATACALAVRLHSDALPLAAGAGFIRASGMSKAALVARWKTEKAEAMNGAHKAFVANYRCGVMLVTCISILAVDFQVFPRRFAKTETYGTGLMDLGTGAVMFASGVVLGRPPAVSDDAVGNGAAGGGGSSQLRRPRRLLAALPRALTSSWPLVALGLARLVSVKALGYQEHVSEYGVHWNFFATILCVRIAAAAAHAALAPPLRAPLALALLLSYQAALSWSGSGLAAWLMDDGPREGLPFLSQNREGICGLPGFAAVLFVGEDVARRTLWQPPAPRKAAAALLHWRLALARLATAAALLWAAALAARAALGGPSRRATDLPYVLWCCAHNALLLLAVAAVDLYSSRPPGCVLGARVSAAMFPVFAVANLATGAVNLAVRTLEAGDGMARALLALYMVAVCGSAWRLGCPRTGKVGSAAKQC